MIAVADEAGHVTRHTFDLDGLRTSTTMPNGQREYLGYDKDAPIQNQRGNLIFRAMFPAPREGGPAPPAIVQRYDYEPLFNQVRRVTDSRGFQPVTDPPPEGVNARAWLQPNGLEAHFSVTSVYDYQELPATTVPPDLTRFGITAAELLASGVALNLGDQNFDGVPPPHRAYHGNLIKHVGPRIRLDPASPEATRLGTPEQVASSYFQFNEHGQPVRAIDAEGNVTTYSYYADSGASGRQLGYLAAQVEDTDATGEVTRSTSSPPQRIETRYEYDERGFLRRTIDGRGTATDHTWSLDGDLLETRSAANRPGLGYLQRFTYDQNRNLIKVELEDRDGPDSVPGRFFTRVMVHDLLNQVVEDGSRLEHPTPRYLVTRHSYDAEQLLVRTELPRGNVITQEYEERRLLRARVRGAGTAQASREQWSYDPNRNMVLALFPDEVSRVELHYDAFDRLERVVSPVGSEELRSYDQVSNLVAVERRGAPTGPSPAGNDTSRNVLLARTELVYDDQNRPIETRALLYAVPSAPEAYTNRVVFDRLNRVTHRIEVEPPGHPGGDRVELIVFDGLSRVVESVDAAGNRTEAIYDAGHNLVLLRERERSALVPEETYLTRLQYDFLDRMTRTTDPLGQTERFAYDSRGNLVAQSDAEGPLLAADPDGLFPGPINGPGNTTTRFYDALSRPTRQVVDLRQGGRGDGALDLGNPFNADGRIELAYAWDDNSNLESIRDDAGNRTLFVWDPLDRKEAEIYADDTRTLFQHDREHNVVQVTDPAGSVVTKLYDQANRLIECQVARGPGIVGTTRETYEWDGLSRLIGTSDDNGAPGSVQVTRYGYDTLSRLARETQHGQDLLYGYDLDGTLNAFRYPGGRVLTFDDDLRDRVTRVHGGAAVLARFEYVGPGLRELQRTHGNGTQRTYLDDAETAPAGYDGLRRPQRPRTKAPGGGLLLDREYAYNRANMRTSVKRHDEAGLTDRYAFDSAYRIRETELDRDGSPGATLREVTGLQYLLDGVGNRRRVEELLGAGGSRTVDYQVNELNQYVQKGTVARAHSPNGNLTDDGTRLFRWDYKNRLVQVLSKASGQPLATYLYDASNRRTKKLLHDATGAVTREVRYHYAGWSVCEEQDGQGATLATYVWGPEHQDDVVQIERSAAHPLGAATLYLHQDPRGDVVAVSDDAGAVVERRRYDDFGQGYDPATGQPAVASQVGNPFGFQGAWLDEESGLYCYRNRFYDPAAGRFLQRDPVWDAGNFGNQYTFAGNNPTSMADPSGQYAETAWDLASLTMGLVSFGTNLGTGEWKAAAVDAVGIVADLVALVIPGLPGGAGAAVKAYRLANKAHALYWAGHWLDRTIDTAQFVSQSVNAHEAGVAAYGSFQEGEYGWGAFQAALAGFSGVGGVYKGGLAIRGVCFLEGTLVEVEGGRKPIEQVRVGDRVLSRDERTGEQGYREVQWSFRGACDQVLYLRVAEIPSPAHQRGRSERHRVGEPGASAEPDPDPDLGEAAGEQTIRSTPGHPYHVAGRGWVQGQRLRVGDRLVGPRGEALRVVGVEVREEQALHFNLEVAGWHTYFVAGDLNAPAVWVHNAGCGDIALGRDPEMKLLAQKTGSAYYKDWAAAGVTRRSVATPGFGRAFHEAAERAKGIHFAIDRIEGSLADAVRRGARGFSQGTFTDAELRHIVRNDDLFAKTTFYEDVYGTMKQIAKDDPRILAARQAASQARPGARFYD